MKKRTSPFSKFVFGTFLTVFALSFIFLSGDGNFPKPNIIQAADSRTHAGLTPDNPSIRAVIEVQNRHIDRLKRIPGVVGIGTGIGANGQAVIRVFTRRAGMPGIPESLDGVPVRVKVTGMFIALADPTARFDRPVPIGVSTGHPEITAGTIGARVKDGQGYVYALSNNHVYANINDASRGDSALQPGPYDGGNDPDDKIGELEDFEPIDFSLFGSNTMDAAIVRTTPVQLGTATLAEGYGTPNSTIFNDADGNGYFDNKTELLNLQVQKFGRTTGLTHGIVSEINVTSMVCYANCSNPYLSEYAWFDDQISITGINGQAFSLGGDSGSLVVTDDDNKNPVGLLFAGSSTITLVNRIDLVLNRFGVSIDDTEQIPPADEVCNNELDDDGDGLVDCDDGDCSQDPHCQNGCGDGVCEAGEDCHNCYEDCMGGEIMENVCGNGVCEAASGEDCRSCPDDCAGKQNGKPSKQFCCGLDVGCDDQRCTSEGFACSEALVVSYCCGDGICEGIEDSVNCELDCGPPVKCWPKGAVCSTADDCCSQKCAGRICR